MVAADEIRARIQAADEKRIALRTERATSVAELHQQVADKTAELTALTTALRDATRSALEVMSVEELAEFADVPRAELADAGRPRTGGNRSTPSIRSRRKSATKAAPAPVASGAEVSDSPAAGE